MPTVNTRPKRDSLCTSKTLHHKDCPLSNTQWRIQHGRTDVPGLDWKWLCVCNVIQPLLCVPCGI